MIVDLVRNFRELRAVTFTWIIWRGYRMDIIVEIGMVGLRYGGDCEIG